MADARSEQFKWLAVSRGAGVVGALLTSKLLQLVWPFGDDDDGPPFNPADRRITWATAMQWGIAAGVGAGIARVLSQRAAAAGWEAVTGSAPPGMKT